MRSINQALLIAMITIVYTIVFTPDLLAQNTRNYPNIPASTASGRSIGEFITPDGRFDLEAARRTGFQGSLNMNGFKSNINTATGQPVFRPAASSSTAENPDDIYWDNSMSSAIPGVNEPVTALTVYDGKLIAGGDFTTAGGVEANRIAAWDGLLWSPLGSGINNPVYALTVYDGKLIAGGGFTIAGGVEANSIAAWDGSSWSPLSSGMRNIVWAITVYDGKLIAGGWFSAVGVEVNYIAAWDGSSWLPLGSGIGVGDYPYVSALTEYDGKLITGGDFTTAGGVETNGIAAWDGSSWTPLGSGMGGGDYPVVWALTVYDGKLIVGENFTTAGGKVAPYIASWTKKDTPDEVEQLNLPSTLRLLQNYPNPFNPVTTISYDVPAQSRVILIVYNILGQPVKTLVDDIQYPGSYHVTWDGTNQFGVPVSMGVYFYRLQAGDYRETKKMLLLK